MAGLLHKLKSLAQGTDREEGSPFVSIKATQKWLHKLPATSDYDLHHALVEGLELYNGDIRGDTLTRVEVLRAIEQAGLPLQEHLVEQFLRIHAISNHAKQTLWRECHLFWDQLAVAYLPFLRMALNEGEKGKLFSQTAEIAVRSMRYVSWGMRWEYLRGRRPGPSSWRRLHKIYRMAEMSGVSLAEIAIAGEKSSCVREYVMTLLFDLASPYAFQPEEIPPVLEILARLKQLPVPESSLRHGKHSHMIDLAAPEGPESIEERWVPGGRLRYLDFFSVVQELERGTSHDKALEPLTIKLSKVIGRAGSSRRGPRKPRFGEVKAVFGAEEVLKMLDPNRKLIPKTEIINLRDESVKGIGFAFDEEHALEAGDLMAVDRDGGHGAWQLLAVRWMDREGYQWQLGTEILSKHPKLVRLEWETDDSKTQTTKAIFLPLASASQGSTSNLLLPDAAYTAGRMLVLIQDDGTSYRLRLGDIVETHQSWLRISFDVLSREAARTIQ